MKIISVITDSSKRSSVLITDAFQVLNIAEALELVRQGGIKGIHIVRGPNSSYIRTNRRFSKLEKIDQLSVTGDELAACWQGFKSFSNLPGIQQYIDHYLESIKQDTSYITPVGQFKILKIAIEVELKKYRDLIFDGSSKFSVDPYLLGAILIDEMARVYPFEEIVDKYASAVVNTSIGIAQVTTDTANKLIKRGLYNPNPEDKLLPFKNKRLNMEARVHLSNYLIEPRHSIYFAAALLHSLVEDWKQFINLKEHPDILATLYSLGREPHLNPEPNERGSQIATEFYNLAKNLLG